MRILYQPTQGTPSDWKEVDSAGWPGVVGQSFLMHALCVQGVVFEGPDHYAVRTIAPGISEVAVWHDDLTDWPVGYRWARVVTFRQLAPDQDPRFGGAINTRQTQVVYAEDGIRSGFEAAYKGNPKVKIEPWSAFDPRTYAYLSGVWVSDQQHEAYEAARSIRGWREWTEGLAAGEIGLDGKLKPQRTLGRYVKPGGTQTFYHRSTDLAVGAYSAAHENELALATGVASLETVTQIKDQGKMCFVATTVAGRPSSAAWPTSGTYRYQIDATVVGSDLTFGLLTQGGDAGCFARLNSALDTILQSFSQGESAFFGSGYHLATLVDPSWSAGSASDRFAAALAGVRITGHVGQILTLQLNEADDSADGPWTEVVDEANALFFGCNF